MKVPKVSVYSPIYVISDSVRWNHCPSQTAPLGDIFVKSVSPTSSVSPVSFTGGNNPPSFNDIVSEVHGNIESACYGPVKKYKPEYINQLYECRLEGNIGSENAEICVENCEIGGNIKNYNGGIRIADSNIIGNIHNSLANISISGSNIAGHIQNHKNKINIKNSIIRGSIENTGGNIRLKNCILVQGACGEYKISIAGRGGWCSFENVYFVDRKSVMGHIKNKCFNIPSSPDGVSISLEDIFNEAEDAEIRK